jgi:hypothetical protein
MQFGVRRHVCFGTRRHVVSPKERQAAQGRPHSKVVDLARTQLSSHRNRARTDILRFHFKFALPILLPVLYLFAGYITGTRQVPDDF